MTFGKSAPLVALGVAIGSIAIFADGDALAPGAWIVSAAAASSVLAVLLLGPDGRGDGRYRRPPPRWPRGRGLVPADCPAYDGRRARRMQWVPPRLRY